MLQVRWHGRGGQGCFTAARLLGRAAILDGLQALAFPSFGPERRGAPVMGYTRIDDRPVRDRSAVRFPDVVVVLDRGLLAEATGAGLSASGVLLLNAPKGLPVDSSCFQVHSVDAFLWAEQVQARPVINMAMLGVLLAWTKIVSLNAAKEAIAEEFDSELRRTNLELLQLAYQSTLP
jgi:pyruvate ferredoxin oxidoreductase gamma subunit